ncbi:MAG: dipeptide ABC transporter ATP-binding protein [Gulosibacter sp.]|uniref:dipeptide ABC transporter ATP-binding protein n=1 Tax=Gulosibacter sp. TaxID=2817531 RepID=UPI003F9376FB
MTPSTSPATRPAASLEIRDLNVSYRQGRSSVAAVRHVDLVLRPGEVLAIVGESGSGKSTLASALLGLHERSVTVAAERMRILGQDMRDARERDWRHLRQDVISLVPQDPLVSLNPSMRIGQQVLEALRSSDARRQDPAQVLHDAGLDDPEQQLRKYPHELSGGQRQRVLIAIALACEPQLIIADEPTSALDVTVQRRILDHLERLVQARGISLILITHDLAVAAERSHRMLVLDQGLVAEQGPTQEVLESRSPVVRQLLDAAPARSASGELELGRFANGEPDLAPSAAEPLIAFRGVSKQYRVRAVDNVQLEIPRGQTLGIVGESGSGKSTLLRIALALTQPSSGEVTYAGESLQELGPRALRALRRKFQFVQQDPFASFDPRYTVGRAIAEPLDAFRIGTRQQRRARVRELLEMVDLPAEFAERLPHQLSGGQRQRVAVARALAAEPETIYLDEPVSALDATVQKRLLDTLVAIQRDLGVTYVFVSHDLAVIARIAHRVAVMQHGRIVEEGPAPQVLHDPRAGYTQALLAAVPKSIHEPQTSESTLHNAQES